MLRSKPTLLGSGWITFIIAFSIFFAPMLNMAQTQDCFSPNGSVLRGFGLCDPTNSTSVCCKLTESCIEFGLCSTPSGFLYRGGCTDGSFKSGVCPKVCIDSESRKKPKSFLTLELIVTPRLCQTLDNGMSKISRRIRGILL